MIIDISGIIKAHGLSMSLDGVLKKDSIGFNGEEIKILHPMVLSGNISNMDDYLLLSTNVKGDLQLECGLCTEHYTYHVDFSLEAKLVKSQENSGPDDFVYSGSNVDLSEIISEYLLLELPIQRKCSESCKGLCKNCGRNLNNIQCQCDNHEDNNDIRLSVLKDLFPRKEV